MSHCLLCSNALPAMAITEGNHAFCCQGCHLVFNILSAKNQLEHFEEHPLFQNALRTGLISNPHLIEQIRQSRAQIYDNEKEKLHLEIGDMWCPACAEVIRLFLLQHKGIVEVIIDYSTDLAMIEYCPCYIGKADIGAAIAKLGYQPFSLEERGEKAVSSELTLRFVIAAFCSLNTMMFAYPLYATYFHYDPADHGLFFAWLAFAASLPILFYCAVPIFRRFYHSLRTGLFGMETLVVMGIGTSFGLSTYNLLNGSNEVYFDSMTVIVTFLLLGKILEAKAKFSAKESLFRLHKLLPRKGRKRFPGGIESFVLVKEIYPGDEIRILAGEKVVLDGVVIEGMGNSDESLMTGESLPVSKEVGSRVIGGAILLQGNLLVRVTAEPDQSALHKIIDLVEQDLSNKTLYVRQADVIVKWFVPFVIAIAFITAIVTFLTTHTFSSAVVRAVTVLLISCPCAIGIAAPLAESALIYGLVSLGAIVRNRGSLAILGRETVYVFDKTGTVTEGRLTLLGGLEHLDSDHKSLLKGMVLHSNHLIAQCLSKSILEEPHPFDQIQEQTGKGIKAISDSCTYLLGSAPFLQQHNIHISTSQERNTTVYFAKDSQLLASLTFGDQIRPEIPSLIQALQPRKCILLSGDGEASVSSIAQSCGFSIAKARCSPLDKKLFIEQLQHQGEIVCFIGDGINDAPALTSANIGISISSASDISIQVSDILLTSQKLSTLFPLFSYAKKGRKILRQNLFWAFFYNGIGVGLACAGVLTPIFSAVAMTVSSLIVVLNARRIVKP